MHCVRQAHDLKERPIRRKIGKVRRHHRYIELGPPRVRVGLDPAIGHNKRLAPRQPGNLVRTDTPRGKLPDAPIPRRPVPYPDHALPGVIVILGGEQERAIQREHTMPIKMPPLRAFEPMQHRPALAIEHKGEIAGPPRETNRLCRRGMRRRRMSPRRKRHREHRRPRPVHPIKTIAPRTILCRAEELHIPKPGPSHRRHDPCRHCPGDETTSRYHLNPRPMR